jgi:hypothetical protein
MESLPSSTANVSVFHDREGNGTCVTESPGDAGDNVRCPGQCREARRKETAHMELAALVLFGSIALWVVGEASGPQHL